MAAWDDGLYPSFVLEKEPQWRESIFAKLLDQVFPERRLAAGGLLIAFLAGAARRASAMAAA